MKIAPCMTLAVCALACSQPGKSDTSQVTPVSSGGAQTGERAFLSVSTRAWRGADGPFAALLPLPVRRNGAVYVAVMFRPALTIAAASEEERRRVNAIHLPAYIDYRDPSDGARHFFDPRTGQRSPSQVPFGSREGEYDPARYFGMPTPPDGVVGQYDDPAWLPQARADLLRTRIHSALDTLLPFFADESRPWTEEANEAAQEVRDFFPLAAEPGLWPYYKAEGREFFAWVETNAPPAKAALPWDEAPR